MIINQKDDLADLWRKFYFNAYLKFVKLSAKFSRNTNQLFIHFLYSISKLRKLEEKYAQSHLSESYVFLKISLQRLKFLCNGIAYFTAFLKLKCGISYNASLQVQTLLHLNFLYHVIHIVTAPSRPHYKFNLNYNRIWHKNDSKCPTHNPQKLKNTPKEWHINIRWPQQSTTITVTRTITNNTDNNIDNSFFRTIIFHLLHEKKELSPRILIYMLWSRKYANKFHFVPLWSAAPTGDCFFFLKKGKYLKLNAGSKKLKTWCSITICKWFSPYVTN